MGPRSVFEVILGTGVGGGICWQEGLVHSPNGITGYWGHNLLPLPEQDELPGPDCYCGRKGCIETLLSGPGFRRVHFEETGRNVSPEEINNGALNGDNGNKESLKRYEGRLVRGLPHVMNILDPEVIVLGGGLSNLERLYRNVPARWAKWVFSDRVDTKLVPPKHGDSSGVRGAAWLWPR